MSHRYEPILTPDESWMVFDILLEAPAELDGRCLIGLPPTECGILARWLNSAQAQTEEREPWKN